MDQALVLVRACGYQILAKGRARDVFMGRYVVVCMQMCTVRGQLHVRITDRGSDTKRTQEGGYGTFPFQLWDASLKRLSFKENWF